MKFLALMLATYLFLLVVLDQREKEIKCNAMGGVFPLFTQECIGVDYGKLL